MGQYHMPANLDRKEFIHPHQLGDGLKMLEFGCSRNGTLTGLTILLACSHDRGGGDLHGVEDDPIARWIAGRWAGDRIAIVGDYSEASDMVVKDGEPTADKIWDLCSVGERSFSEHESYVNDPDYSALLAEHEPWHNISYYVVRTMLLDGYVRDTFTRPWSMDLAIASELNLEDGSLRRLQHGKPWDIEFVEKKREEGSVLRPDMVIGIPPTP